MEAATPGGLARTEDPGLSFAREAADVLPPGKRPQQWKSTFLLQSKGHDAILVVSYYMLANPLLLN